MANTVNSNQFKQVPVRGDMDLQISKSGVITGQISTNQATALLGGAFVKLDTANTGPVPQFVAAATSDTGVLLGSIIRNTKQDSYSALDYVEVASPVGPVIWVVAGGTIAPGAEVEDTGSSTVQTKSAGALRGFALDPGSNGNMMRIVLVNPV